MREYNVCELFAGAGGLSEGFRQCGGYRIVCANEYDEKAAETYIANHTGTRLIVGDVTNPGIKDAICESFRERECDVLIGGVPCQPWSQSGNRLGFEDPRGRLWFDYIEMAERLRPLAVVAENVPGMLRFRDAIRTLRERFDRIGYSVEMRVLSAADFGAPQKRHRLIFIGIRRDHRHGPIIWPHPVRKEIPSTLAFECMCPDSDWDDYLRDYPAWLTVREALAPYVEMPEDPSIAHVFARSKQTTMARIRSTPPGKSLYDFGEAWLRLRPDSPAPTAKSNNGGVFVHPSLDRTLTPREMAALQGFPDSYLFRGTKSSMWTQIGNAVPPHLGRAVAVAVRRMLAPKPDANLLLRHATEQSNGRRTVGYFEPPSTSGSVGPFKIASS